MPPPLSPPDYLYRITAQNSAGSDVSPWVVTMTEESGRSTIMKTSDNWHLIKLSGPGSKKFAHQSVISYVE